MGDAGAVKAPNCLAVTGLRHSGTLGVPPSAAPPRTFLMATPEVPERDLSARMAALIMS